MRAYRQNGEAGLTDRYSDTGRSLPSPVKEKIVEIKQTNPLFGIKVFNKDLRLEFA